MSRHETPMSPVTTPYECVRYVDHIGLCTWQRRPGGLPSLEEATPWDGDTHALMNATWSWKDDLHIEKRVFYGLLLGSGIPTFVSRAFLPLLIAAQGDNDPRTLYEKNRLSRTAIAICEHVERNGPTASNALPGGGSERTRALVSLQQHFILTKHALTGRTRGTYGYIYGACDTFVPDAFGEAARLRVAAAREEIVARLGANNETFDRKRATRLFRWSEDE